MENAATRGAQQTHQTLATEALHVIMALENTKPRILRCFAAFAKSEPKAVAVRCAAKSSYSRGHRETTNDVKSSRRNWHSALR